MIPPGVLQSSSASNEIPETGYYYQYHNFAAGEELTWEITSVSKDQEKEEICEQPQVECHNIPDISRGDSISYHFNEDFDAPYLPLNFTRHPEYFQQVEITRTYEVNNLTENEDFGSMLVHVTQYDPDNPPRRRFILLFPLIFPTSVIINGNQVNYFHWLYGEDYTEIIDETPTEYHYFDGFYAFRSNKFTGVVSFTSAYIGENIEIHQVIPETQSQEPMETSSTSKTTYFLTPFLPVFMLVQIAKRRL